MREFVFEIPNTSKFILSEFFNSTILDIETTGLSKTKDCIFIIGKIEICKNPYLKIYFAENLSEELTILKNLNIEGKKIITYNGDKFDIPFINEKFSKYSIPKLNLPSFDLYKYVNSKNNILNLNRKRQVDVEDFLNIKRKDFVSGGRIADIYKKFLLDKNEESIEIMLSHNKDDLTGLFECLNIVKYVDEKSSFVINNFNYKISDFYTLGNFLYIKGTTNFNGLIVNNFYNGKVIIENNNFIINHEIIEGSYDINRKCKYILKNELPNLKSTKDIRAPELVHIIYLDKFVFENIKELSKYLIFNSLVYKK